MYCCSPSLSANMSLLASCLARVRHEPAWWWVSFFRDFYYPAIARMNPLDIYFVLHPLIFLYLTLLVHCDLSSMSFLFLSRCLLLSVSLTSLLVCWFIGELDTYFFHHHALFSHMLHDWRGPGLHALSFWSQPSPPPLPSHPSFRTP